MKKISLDFDEVLYNLSLASSKFIREVYGAELDNSKVTYWEYLTDHFPRIKEAWGDFSLYSQGEIFKDAPDFVRELQKKYEVQIVTSSYPGIISQKDEMIQDVFRVNVIHTHQKDKVTQNSLLIDDGLHNITAHINAGNGKAIIFDKGYGWNQAKLENGEDIFRAKSYEDILRILNKRAY